MEHDEARAATRATGRVFYGWWIVGACSVLNIYCSGVFFYGFTVVVDPMARDLGLTMAVVSGAFSLQRLESGIAAPLIGYLFDRAGPRKLVMAGSAIMGGAFILLANSETVFPFYTAFFLISLGSGFVSGPAMAGALIGKWFMRRRGWALGVYSAGVGLSGLVAPLLSYLIGIYGWRPTLLFLGPFTLLVTMPLALVLRHKPEDRGLLPDGDPAGSGIEDGNPAASAVLAAEPDFPVHRALRTRSFWLLTGCYLVFHTAMSALFVHIVPSLLNWGVQAQLAALVVSGITLVSIPGRLGFGRLADRFSKKWVLVAIFTFLALGMLAFANAQQPLFLILFLVAYSPAYGGAMVTRLAAIGEYYGRRNLGTINGVMTGFAMLGGIAGPVIAGYSFDSYGDYRPIFLILAAFSVLSVVLLSFLKRPGQGGAAPDTALGTKLTST